MNKTININLGGLVFHIDENAYNKLQVYLDAIKQSLDEDSKDEVMNDIEARIAEILNSRIQVDKQVINILDIEHIISVMGQPEDYIIADEDFNSKKKQEKNTYVNFGKKLFRDEDDGRLGGVCAGLGHYFGIDSIWIRILFIILFFTYGTSVLIYLILWILLPKAVTASEKLQMMGEPVNIANIEKKIRESFDHEEFNKKSRKAVSKFENIAKGLFNFISKLFGGFLLLVSTIGLGSILVFGGTLILASVNIIDNANISVPFESLNLFWFAVLLIFTAGIPIFFLILLSLKILSPNYKFLGRYTNLSLLAIWILSLIGWTLFGITQSITENYVGKTSEKIELNLQPSDTLKINTNNNIYYSSEEIPKTAHKVVPDEKNKKVLYSNRVELVFKETEDKPYMVIEKSAKNTDIDTAKKISENILYNTQVTGNTITADNYLLSYNKNNKSRQQVKLYVYIPKNTILKLNKGARYISNTTLNSNQEAEYPIFKFEENNQINCINCTNKPDNFNNQNRLEQEVDSILNAID